jgi:hypothetical protein
VAFACLPAARRLHRRRHHLRGVSATLIAGRLRPCFDIQQGYVTPAQLTPLPAVMCCRCCVQPSATVSTPTQPASAQVGTRWRGQPGRCMAVVPAACTAGGRLDMPPPDPARHLFLQTSAPAPVAPTAFTAAQVRG